MTALINQKIQPYNKNSMALSSNEIGLLIMQLSDWEIENRDKVKQLKRTFTFNNFSSALEFSNKVAELAESVNHHPCICIEWGKSTICWWTHSISGLFINDFILAAKCDKLYTEC